MNDETILSIEWDIEPYPIDPNATMSWEHAFDRLTTKGKIRSDLSTFANTKRDQLDLKWGENIFKFQDNKDPKKLSYTSTVSNFIKCLHKTRGQLAYEMACFLTKCTDLFIKPAPLNFFDFTYDQIMMWKDSHETLVGLRNDHRKYMDKLHGTRTSIV